VRERVIRCCHGRLRFAQHGGLGPRADRNGACASRWRSSARPRFFSTGRRAPAALLFLSAPLPPVVCLNRVGRESRLRLSRRLDRIQIRIAHHESSFAFVGSREPHSVASRSADDGLVNVLVVRRSAERDRDLRFIEAMRGRGRSRPAHRTQHAQCIQERLHIHRVDRLASLHPHPLVLVVAHQYLRGCSPRRTTKTSPEGAAYRVRISANPTPRLPRTSSLAPSSTDPASGSLPQNSPADSSGSRSSSSRLSAPAPSCLCPA